MKPTIIDVVKTVFCDTEINNQPDPFDIEIGSVSLYSGECIEESEWWHSRVYSWVNNKVSSGELSTHVIYPIPVNSYYYEDAVLTCGNRFVKFAASLDHGLSKPLSNKHYEFLTDIILGEIRLSTGFPGSIVFFDCNKKTVINFASDRGEFYWETDDSLALYRLYEMKTK